MYCCTVIIVAAAVVVVHLSRRDPPQDSLPMAWSQLKSTELLHPWYRRGWWLVTGLGPRCRQQQEKKNTIRYLSQVSAMHTVSVHLSVAARSLFQDFTGPTGLLALQASRHHRVLGTAKSSLIYYAVAVLFLQTPVLCGQRKREKTTS